MNGVKEPINGKSSGGDTSSFVSFSEIALAIMGLLWFHISFRIVCSSSVRNVVHILIGIALNL